MVDFKCKLYMNKKTAIQSRRYDLFEQWRYFPTNPDAEVKVAFNYIHKQTMYKVRRSERDMLATV